MSDTKLVADTIAELQDKIATQRELICNLTAMNDELQAKLDRIEQIVNSWDSSIVLSANDWKYISEIKEVLEQE